MPDDSQSAGSQQALALKRYSRSLRIIERERLIDLNVRTAEWLLNTASHLDSLRRSLPVIAEHVKRRRYHVAMATCSDLSSLEAANPPDILKLFEEMAAQFEQCSEQPIPELTVAQANAATEAYKALQDAISVAVTLMVSGKVQEALELLRTCLGTPSRQIESDIPATDQRGSTD